MLTKGQHQAYLKIRTVLFLFVVYAYCNILHYCKKTNIRSKVILVEDYAGVDGQPIKGIRVYLDGDTLAVQTHHMSNGNIDKLTIFAGKNTIRYRVRVIGASDYYSWMENKKDTGGSSDTFAGEAGKAIDRVQIVVK